MALRHHKVHTIWDLNTVPEPFDVRHGLGVSYPTGDIDVLGFADFHHASVTTMSKLNLFRWHWKDKKTMMIRLLSGKDVSGIFRLVFCSSLYR